MLIENAFHYLPEILSGSNYAVQEYEAGIVNAVSLAVLQELNARNIPNPLAVLTVERPYSREGFERPDGKQERRHLRADLFVDISRNHVSTEALSRFGWRHLNYLEAKFFRPGCGPSTSNAALLLADLIRLCCLTPPWVKGWNAGKHSRPCPCAGVLDPSGKYTDICVGRYLLHVYEGDPDVLVGKRVRPWLKELRSPSGSVLRVTVRDDKASTFIKSISPFLQDLSLDVSITNRVLVQRPSAKKTHYLCVLTRIDRLKVTLGSLSWEETVERQGTESASGDWQRLQKEVGKYILFGAKAKPESEDVPPSDDELESFESSSSSESPESADSTDVVSSRDRGSSVSSGSPGALSSSSGSSSSLSSSPELSKGNA
jgi:hypothetical protein